MGGTHCKDAASLDHARVVAMMQYGHVESNSTFPMLSVSDSGASN